MKKEGQRLFIGVVILCAIAIIFLLFFVNTKESKNIDDLQKVEVKEYEGNDLSSVADFRENSIKGPQYINNEYYELKITGLVLNERSYTLEELSARKHYKKVVTLDCVEGWSATILWEGFLVKDLLDEAVPKESAKTVIFHAKDNYTTSFPLEYFNKNIIIADKMNGHELLPERGYPLQLVAESKWGYKWIKWITKIEISDDEDYRGYWESRGFSKSADLNESFRS